MDFKAICPVGNIYGNETVGYFCRCLICGRCGQHTGNNTQGHLWGFCKVTKTIRESHYCCPDDCELEV